MHFPNFPKDHIFGEDTSTAEMFEKIAKPIVDATLKGFNGTIFAYGQTSSGEEENCLLCILRAFAIFLQ